MTRKRKPVDRTVVKELDCIDVMLQAASEYGLETEVVWELCNTLRHNSNVEIQQAAFEALAEWDL